MAKFEGAPSFSGGGKSLKRKGGKSDNAAFEGFIDLATMGLLGTMDTASKKKKKKK